MAPQLERLFGTGLKLLSSPGPFRFISVSPVPPSLPRPAPLPKPVDLSPFTDDLEEEGALAENLNKFSGIMCLLFSKTTCGRGGAGLPGPFSDVTKFGSLANSNLTGGDFALFVSPMADVPAEVSIPAAVLLMLVSPESFSISFFGFFFFGAFLNVTLSTPMYLHREENISSALGNKCVNNRKGAYFGRKPNSSGCLFSTAS